MLFLPSLSIYVRPSVYTAAGGNTPSEPSKEEEEIKTEIKGTWACAFSSRGFGTVKKEAVLDLLAHEIGRTYKVDITNAQHTFLVEVNPVRLHVLLTILLSVVYPFSLD